MTDQDIEKMAKELKAILEKLDKAIEEAGRDASNVNIADVTKILQSNLVKMNKRYEGNGYESILSILDDRIAKITEKIKTDKKLDVDEAQKLTEIRKEIQKGREPFQKTKDVIKSLEQKGFSIEDLRNRKEGQREDKKLQLKANKKVSEELALGIADLEARYIEPINKNKEILNLMEKMGKKRILIDKLDPKMDKDRIDELKVEITSHISDLSARGIDVTGLNNFENNLNKIDTFVNAQVPITEQKSKDIVAKIASDKTIPLNIRNQFGLYNVTDIKSLEEKYNSMNQQRMAYATKTAVLKNEISQIDALTEEFKKDNYLKSIVYNEDGTMKDDDRIAQEVISNPKMLDAVNDKLASKFGDSFFESFRSRRAYFKEQEGKGIVASVKAVFKGLFSSSNKVKLLAERTEAINYGKRNADLASNIIESRRKTFQNTLRKEVQGKVAKNPKISVESIKDGVIEKASEEASRHIGDR